MSSTRRATLATPFEIGHQLFDQLGLRDQRHCIGDAYEHIQNGKQDIMFAGGSEELDWTLSVLFDAMGAMSTKYNETPEGVAGL